MTDFSTLPTTLTGLLTERASLTPAVAMLIDEHGHSLTFAEVHAASEQVAAGLYDLGLRSGDTASWQLPTQIDTVLLSLALARLGAVQNPIIPVYRRREVEAMVRQSNADWLITLATFRGFDHAGMAEEVAAACGVRTLVLDANLPTGDPSVLPSAPTADEQIKWIYTTSGTTSAPKGVCHSDRSLIAGALGLADAIDFSTSDVATIFFPYAHIGGPDMMIAGLAVGMPLLLMEAFEVGAAIALMREHGATVTGGGTTFYQLYLKHQAAAGDEPLVPTLRAFSGGGAPMPAAVFHAVKEGMGIRILHGYGMTESPMITVGRPDDEDLDLATTEGKPVLGGEVAIRSESGELLGPGETGQVWVRGPMLFHHYLIEGDVVVPHDADGWFSTGDIGFRKPSGHVVLVGRAKDLIIRKGESISPMEIEEVVKQHPAVVDAAVVGLPDVERGERICAVLELVPGTPAPDVAALQLLCAQSGLARFKSPEQVEVVTSMPRTPTFKILKQQLRRQLSGDSADPTHLPQPVFQNS